MSTPAALTEALRTCLERRLTFAAFRVPGQAPQLWAQRTPELETVSGAWLLELNQVFLLAPFDLDGERVPFIRSDVELLFGEIAPDISHLAGCTGTNGTAQAFPAPTTETEFLGNVATAHAAFARHTLAKVVLSRTLRTPCGTERLPELFLRALAEHPHAFVALTHTPDHGTWLGASPERLIQETEDHVRVDAIAGTMTADIAHARPSEWGAKEREEQMLVTRHVLDTFVQLDVRDVVARGPEVLQAGPVAHLRTTVEGDLGDRTLGELVLALHPTPAICGTPTSAARDLIRRTERHDRALYSGFWGPWNADGPTELFVNIRCLRQQDGEAQLFVGAGITAGSDPGGEWAETGHKAAMWLRLMEAS